MAYCTQADIIKSLPEAELAQLTDDSAGTTVDSDVVNESIAWADALIDTYCRQKYSVPFSTTPEMIKGLSIDLAIYDLFTRRVHGATPDMVMHKYDQAMLILRDISQGKAFVLDTEVTEDTAAGEIIQEGGSVFTRSSMEEW